MSYSPNLSIIETYETSKNLKCLNEILHYKEENDDPEYRRDLIDELQVTLWTSAKTENVTFPNNNYGDIKSNLLETEIKKIDVIDFDYFS